MLSFFCSMIPQMGDALGVLLDEVAKAHNTVGRKHHAILLDLITKEDIGTMICGI
jgi:acetylglutamate kinase